MIRFPQHISLLSDGSIVRSKGDDYNYPLFDLKMNLESNHLWIDYYCPEQDLTLSDIIVDSKLNIEEQNKKFSRIIEEVAKSNTPVFYI